MENKTPTAEDFLQDHLQISHFYDDKTETMVCFSHDVQKAMIEFAKLHVEIALEAAAKSAMFSHESGKGKIHYDAYPLTLIK